jgi:hypothetical protein
MAVQPVFVMSEKEPSHSSRRWSSVSCVIEYVVSPRRLAPDLAAHLRGLGCDASTRGQRLWATHPTAADPTEERLVLGGAIAAWRREHPDARIDPTDYEPPPEMHQWA